MTPLLAQLTKYGNYHRDRRNIFTHLFGVPVIMFSVVCFLSRPPIDLGFAVISPVWAVALAALTFYTRLDRRYGIAMAVQLTLFIFLARFVAALPTTSWLLTSAGLFFGGWVVQFIGHYFEGRKPAFVDDIIGLLVGPLFVTAEFGFLLGLRKEVEAELTRISGPVYVRDLSTPAAPLPK